MEDISKFLEKYKNIAKVFPKEWFEAELQKSEVSIHLLAKQFNFEDHPYNNSISFHLFDHIDNYLGTLMDEIHKKGSILRKLRNSKEYPDTINQIEIGYFFKKLGFSVEFEPKLPNSKKVSDIKISNGKYVTYIEVRTLYDRPGKVMFQSDTTTISTVEFHPIFTLQSKIKEKSQQLSDINPGIVVVYLDDPISRTLHIEYAFNKIAKQCPLISGLLLYHHYYNQNGCSISVKLFCNPFAKNPFPTSDMESFDYGGVHIIHKSTKEKKIHVNW